MGLVQPTNLAKCKPENIRCRLSNIQKWIAALNSGVQIAINGLYAKVGETNTNNKNVILKGVNQAVDKSTSTIKDSINAVHSRLYNTSNTIDDINRKVNYLAQNNNSEIKQNIQSMRNEVSRLPITIERQLKNYHTPIIRGQQDIKDMLDRKTGYIVQQITRPINDINLSITKGLQNTRTYITNSNNRQTNVLKTSIANSTKTINAKQIEVKNGLRQVMIETSNSIKEDNRISAKADQAFQREMFENTKGWIESLLDMSPDSIATLINTVQSVSQVMAEQLKRRR